MNISRTAIRYDRTFDINSVGLRDVESVILSLLASVLALLTSVKITNRYDVVLKYSHQEKAFGHAGPVLTCTRKMEFKRRQLVSIAFIPIEYSFSSAGWRHAE